MKLKVKEHLGFGEKHALHYWEGLCHNSLCPAIKLYIPSLCLIFMRFLQYLRFLEGEICLVSLGCILLEITPIPGCYHFPRVGTFCPLTPFDAYHHSWFSVPAPCPWVRLSVSYEDRIWFTTLILALLFLVLGGFSIHCIYFSLFLLLCCMVTFWYFWQIIKVMIINFR